MSERYTSRVKAIIAWYTRFLEEAQCNVDPELQLHFIQFLVAIHKLTEPRVLTEVAATDLVMRSQLLSESASYSQDYALMCESYGWPTEYERFLNRRKEATLSLREIRTISCIALQRFSISLRCAERWSLRGQFEYANTLSAWVLSCCRVLFWYFWLLRFRILYTRTEGCAISCLRQRIMDKSSYWDPSRSSTKEFQRNLHLTQLFLKIVDQPGSPDTIETWKFIERQLCLPINVGVRLEVCKCKAIHIVSHNLLDDSSEVLTYSESPPPLPIPQKPSSLVLQTQPKVSDYSKVTDLPQYADIAAAINSSINVSQSSPPGSRLRKQKHIHPVTRIDPVTPDHRAQLLLELQSALNNTTQGSTQS
eukprot:Blabericola_migrator_1__10567@NODE_5_length_29060_cov_171_088642_g4_i0_p9_GENE_NODE_5_length_29060_cov_171_088642_g4_i0NODE_5_length_29060_cov_171_088642_g4_i0_p9_ORF_typecomplete_len364_score39_26Thiol_cytolysin/PF01289_19/0_19_NODE_5_length_29060_cov_171_088642_g4_i037874878